MKTPSKKNNRRKKAVYNKGVIVGKPYIKVCPMCFGEKCDYCWNYGTMTYVDIRCNKCHGTGKVKPGTNIKKEDIRDYSKDVLDKYLNSSCCMHCLGKGSTVGHYYN